MTRRSLLYPLAGIGAAAALAAGYTGVDTYLGARRPAPPPAAAAPVATAVATPAVPGRLVIHGTGDVNLDPGELGLVRNGYDQPWTGVAELFGADDLTVVNLECAPGEGGGAEDKEYTFRCPYGHAEMAAAGVEVANLGNNHSLDFGREALTDGLARLRRARIAPVGAGTNATEAREPAIFERSGWTIAVLGFSGVVPSPGWFAGANHPGLANGYDTASMQAAVRAAKARADLVFVTIHWGEELKTVPRARDVARARALVDAGADGIFGHHAHVTQPLEWYADRPIFYGLGNFVWPRPGPTAVARVEVSPDGRIGACLLPGRTAGGRPSISTAGC